LAKMIGCGAVALPARYNRWPGQKSTNRARDRWLPSRAASLDLPWRIRRRRAEASQKGERKGDNAHEGCLTVKLRGPPRRATQAPRAHNVFLRPRRVATDRSRSPPTIVRRRGRQRSRLACHIRPTAANDRPKSLCDASRAKTRDCELGQTVCSDERPQRGSSLASLRSICKLRITCSARPTRVAANPRATIAVAAECQRFHSSRPAVARIAYGTTNGRVQIRVVTSPPRLNGEVEGPPRKRPIRAAGA